MITLDGNRIRAVTTQGITYLDDSGQEQFIDFAQCYEHYLKDSLSPETWERIKEVNRWTDADRDRYIERRKRWKEIGRKQPLLPPWGDGPFLEFYTEPRVRFMLTHDSEEIYGKVLRTIWDAGWKTFDMG